MLFNHLNLHFKWNLEEELVKKLFNYVLHYHICFSYEGCRTPLPQITHSTFPIYEKVQVSTPAECNAKVSTWENGLFDHRYSNAK